MTFCREGLHGGHEPFYYEEMHTFGPRKKLSGKAIANLVIMLTINPVFGCLGLVSFSQLLFKVYCLDECLF